MEPVAVTVTIRTVCHECFGEGVVIHPRAAVRDGEAVPGFDVIGCRYCQEQEWLPGVMAPV